MKRLSPWQQEKQRTAKALRELPKCDYLACEKRGMGQVAVRIQTGDDFTFATLWVCPAHAQKLKAQRAQRERT